MREEILDIAKKLYHNHLTIETGTDLLLGLFNVVGQSEQLPCEHEYEQDCTMGVDITVCKKCGDVI